jgi:hypothetical protein
VGIRNVKTIGKRIDQLSLAALRQRRTVMAKARQAKLPTERCACGCVDNMPTATLTV